MRSRIRTKGTWDAPKQGTSRHAWLESGLPVDVCTGESTLSSIPLPKGEVMWDVVGNRHGLNPVYHVKYQGDMSPLTNYVFKDTQESTRQVHMDPGIFPDSPLSLLSSPGLFAQDFDLGEWLDAFAARADLHHREAMPTDVLIANFIFELKDFVDGKLFELGNIQLSWESAVDKWRKFMRDQANAWLAFNFAIRPFISDLRKICRAWEKSLRRLRWLARNNHNWIRVPYREGPTVSSFVLPLDWAPFTSQLAESSEEGGEVPYCPSFLWQEPFATLEVRGTAKFTLASTGIVRFMLPEWLLEQSTNNGPFSTPVFLPFYSWTGLPFTPTPAEVTAWAKTVGLYDWGDIAWEALPFSWLVDYFLSAKEKLEAFDGLGLDIYPDAEVAAQCWSLSMDSDFEIFAIRDGVDIANLGRVQGRTYIRDTGLPNSAATPFVVPADWYKLSILLAIAANLVDRHWRSSPRV